MKSKGGPAALSIPQLKVWLRARKLPVGGKKDELVARVTAAMGN